MGRGTRPGSQVVSVLARTHPAFRRARPRTGRDQEAARDPSGAFGNEIRTALEELRMVNERLVETVERLSSAVHDLVESDEVGRAEPPEGRLEIAQESAPSPSEVITVSPPPVGAVFDYSTVYQERTGPVALRALLHQLESQLEAARRELAAELPDVGLAWMGTALSRFTAEWGDAADNISDTLDALRRAASVVERAGAAAPAAQTAEASRPSEQRRE